MILRRKARRALLCTVAAVLLPLQASPDTNGPGAVPVLKQTQFALGILTEPASPRTVQEHYATVGQIVPQAGHRVRIYPIQHIPGAPPKPPLDRVAILPRLPHVGDPVRRGQLLTNIEVVISHEAYAIAPRRGPGWEEAAARRRLNEKALHAVRERPHTPEELAAAEEAVATAIRNVQAQEMSDLGPTGSTHDLEPVVATIDGVVGEVLISEGDTVASTHALFTIVDPSTVWIEARVPEADLALVDRFGDARVRTTGTNGWTHARLITVSAEVDRTMRAARAVFEVPNPTGTLRIGNVVEVEIDVGAPRTVLAIPSAAMGCGTDGMCTTSTPQVYVHTRTEEFTPRRIVTGARDGAYQEVRGGLRPGDRVVTQGRQELIAMSPGALHPVGWGATPR